LAGISCSSVGLPTRIYCKNELSSKYINERLVNQIAVCVDKNKSGLINRKIIVIVYQSLGFDKNVKLLNYIKELSRTEKFNNFYFIFKPHPLDKFELYLKFCSSNIFVTAIDVINELKISADLIISSPSEVFSKHLKDECKFRWSLLSIENELIENLIFTDQFGDKIHDYYELKEELLKASGYKNEIQHT
jgi:hypothetical protein